MKNLFKRLKEKLCKYEKGYIDGYAKRNLEVQKINRASMSNENLKYIKLIYPEWIRVCLIVNNHVEICIKSFPRTDDYYAHLQAVELIEMLYEHHNLDYEQTRCN